MPRQATREHGEAPFYGAAWREMRQVIKNFREMTPYERYKLMVDFLRFIATLAAPFVIIFLQWIMRTYYGW